MRPLSRSRLLLATIALLTTGALAACGSDDDASGDSAPNSGDDAISDLQDDTGVPEACREAFPAAVGGADLADVKLVPDGWPEPPVDATLCQTSTTLDDKVEVLSYATDVAPAEILDAYEAAVATSYETTREDQGLGEALRGTAGSTSFEVRPGDGSFSLTFGHG